MSPRNLYTRHVLLLLPLLGVIAWSGETHAAQLSMTWIDTADNEAGFEIEQSSTGPNGPFEWIDTVNADVTSYTDLDLAPVTEYCYRVRAFNSIGTSDYSNVDCATTTAENGPPTADAGPSQTVLLGDAVTLDGVGSSDPDNDPLIYCWDLGDGSASQCSEIVTHAYTAPGTYTATLTVIDTGGLSDTDAAVVTVMADTPNTCPFANLALCATASASSAWSASYAAAKANDSDGSTRWNSASGDRAGAWLALEFGAPTTFDTIVLKEARDRVTGYALQYWTGTQWVDIVTGTTIGTNQTHTFASLTVRRIRLLATNIISGPSWVTPTFYEVEVYQTGSAPAANQPPVADAGPAQTVTVGAPVTLDGTGSSDPEDDPLSYSWDLGDGTIAGGAVVTHTYAAAGDYTVTLSVDDGDLSATDTTVISGTAAAPPSCSFTNLARGATASASSAWSASYAAAKANDSDGSTRWNSASGDRAGAWLALEFDAPTTFDTIVLKEARARITGYALQYWAGTQWVDIVTGTTIGTNQTHTFASLTVRRIRLLATNIISGPSWVTPTIYEVEVYSSGG